MKRVLSAILIAVMLLSCLPIGVFANDGATAPAVSNELPPLVITEISMTANTTSNTDVKKDAASFVEIYNTTDAAIDLSQWWLTYDKDVSRRNNMGYEKIAEEPTMLAAGQVAVLYLQRDEAITIEEFKAFFNEIVEEGNRAQDFENALLITLPVEAAETSTPGVTNSAPFYFGLTNDAEEPARIEAGNAEYEAAKTAGTSAQLPDNDYSAWVSMARYCSYNALGAQLAFGMPFDKTSGYSVASVRASDSNSYFYETTNMVNNTSVNYLYGLTSNDDAKIGIQYTYGSKQMSPGTLTNIQVAALAPHASTLVITAVMANSETFPYITVYNQSASGINLFDYVVLNQDMKALNTYQDEYFSNVATITGGAASQENVALLNAGEYAVIWFADDYANADVAAFRAEYQLKADQKVYVVDTKATGSFALSQTGYHMYGLARKDEAVAAAITYPNGKNYNTNGIAVDKADSFVLLSYQAITGVAGTVEYGIETGEVIKHLSTLGEGVSALYDASFTSRLGAYRDLTYVRSGPSNIGSGLYTSPINLTTANYWAPKMEESEYTSWKVPPIPTGKQPELVITELSITANTTSNTSTTADKASFIEIHNTTNAAIDLSEYAIICDTKAYEAGTALTYQQITTESTLLEAGKTAVLYLQKDETVNAEAFKAFFATLTDAEAAFEDTVVVTVPAAGILGVLNGNAFTYGIVSAKFAPSASDSHVNWVSWVNYNSYAAIGAQLGFSAQGDASTWQSVASCRATDSNAFFKETTNAINNTSVNYVYGLNATADCRQGEQITVGNYQMNPGTLMNWQTAQFEGVAPELVITAIMADSADVTGKFATVDYTADGYEYMTVANAGLDAVNVFDYTLVANLAYNNFTTAYEDAYFTHWNYLISAENGNIWGYDKTAANYADTIISNGSYADGWVKPGDAAVIWFYNEANLGKGSTIADFKAAHGLAEDVKVFVVDATTAETGTATYANRFALANSGNAVYGLAKNEDLTWANGVVTADAITYDNGKNYEKTGINVSDVESYVFLSVQAITGVAGTVSYDATTGETTRVFSTLGEGVPALYSWRNVENSSNRVGAYLDMSYIKTGSSKVGAFYTTATATSTANYWKPSGHTPAYTEWAAVKAGEVSEAQKGDLQKREENLITAIGYQTNTAGQIRVVAVLDNIVNYSAAGFKVSATYGAGNKFDETVTGNTVFVSIVAGNTQVTGTEIGGRDYIVALVLPELLGASGEIVYTVTPFTVNETTGATVYGEAITFTITK